MEFLIRPYQAGDLQAVGQVCLRTGDNGQDASLIYRDHELLGLNFTSPYVVSEPNLAFVLVHENVPFGYVLGTHNTASFCEWSEREWFPPLRQKYPIPDPGDPSPDAEMIRLIYAGRTAKDFTLMYPAHLHLDLLPIAQGQGWGTKMMHVFLDRLRTLKIPGVHLSVGQANHRAIGFYEKMGFHPVETDGQSLIMGRFLSPIKS